MPIEINELHIRSSVVQRARDDDAGERGGAPDEADADEAGDTLLAQREQLLAECRRMIRDALLQLRER
jgi:hypothetical protein